MMEFLTELNDFIEGIQAYMQLLMILTVSNSLGIAWLVWRSLDVSTRESRANRILDERIDDGYW